MHKRRPAIHWLESTPKHSSNVNRAIQSGAEGALGARGGFAKWIGLAGEGFARSRGTGLTTTI